MAASGRSWFLYFLVLCCSTWPNKLQVNGIQEFLGSCGIYIDLLTNNYQSGILRMPMPTSMTDYQDTANPDRFCEVIITFSHNTNLLLELYYLDIIPDKDATGACTTGLEVLDKSEKNVYGGRLCMEAWEWEERHAMSKNEKKIIRGSPVKFRLVSTGPYRGEGFKVHFNLFRPQYPCSNREFKCIEIARCVHDDLTCDGWDDCGDHSDEKREAGCDLLTPSEICAVVMGCLLFLGTLVSTIFFCLAYRSLRRDYGLRSKSKIPPGMDPVLFRRFTSQESMGTHYSKTTGGGRTRRDSDSSIDKLDLEKLDRYTMDNGSERSYRSNAKSKARSLALGSDTASEIAKKTGQYSYNGGRRGRAQSSNSLNKGEAPLKLNGIDNPAAGDTPRESVERDKGRVTPDRRSGSRRRDRDDHSDYSDEDEERRRRRRSRERRSRHYSDEDDYDSDYDRDRRRRRRRRSYSDDDYDSYDSEYERERRRRRRSKERQRRSRELDDEDPTKEKQEDGEDKSDRDTRRRRESRERDRDRNRDSYDSEEEDRRRRRRRRRSPSYDDDEDDYRDRRRRRRSRSYDDDDDEDRTRRRRRRSRSNDDNDDDDGADRDRRRRRSNERRRGQSGDRSRPEPQNSDKDQTDAPREAERMSRALAKEVESKVPKREADRASPEAPPPPSSFRPVAPREGTPPPPFKAKEDTPPPPSRAKDVAPPPPSSGHRAAALPPPAREPSPPPPVTVKQPSNHSYHPPPPQHRQQRLPPVSPPPSGEEIRQMEEERNRRKQQLHQQRIQRHQQPQAPSPPSSTSAAAPADESGDRRRSQDNRRERYSRDRFRQKGRRSDPQPSPPASDYEDVNPRVRLDAPLTGYREETV